MVERPDRAVGEALVVRLDLGSAQRHGHESGALEVERLDVEVGLAAPSHPRAVGLAHDGLEGGDETAGRPPPALLAIRRDHPVDGKAVGDDDEICARHIGSS
ncbi:hypothetical protein GCM10009746_07730 [Microbacterium paludicola]